MPTIIIDIPLWIHDEMTEHFRVNGGRPDEMLWHYTNMNMNYFSAQLFHPYNPLVPARYFSMKMNKPASRNEHSLPHLEIVERDGDPRTYNGWREKQTRWTPPKEARSVDPVPLTAIGLPPAALAVCATSEVRKKDRRRSQDSMLPP